MALTKFNLNKGSSLIKEHWVSESKQEILDEFEGIKINYPTGGYGTMLYNLTPDATGLLWHADFSRFSSCD